MSNSDDRLDRIVDHVFRRGVHSVPADQLDTGSPQQLTATWKDKMASARGTRPPQPADPRPPEAGHEERLFAWLRPREAGTISFAWMDLPSDQPEPDDGDWIAVHRLADWRGTRLPVQ